MRNVLLACVSLFLLLYGVSARSAETPVRPEIARLRALLAAENYAGAESLAVLLIQQFQNSPGVDSLELAEALFGHGQALARQQKWDTDFVGSLTRALEIRKRWLPPNHELIGLNHVELAEQLAGVDAQNALKHARAALKNFEIQPMPNDTLVARAWVDIGEIECILGNAGNALEALAPAREIRTRLFGPFDRRLLWVYVTTGDAHQMLGNFAEAIEAQEQALLIFESTGDRNNLSRGAPISRLAHLNMEIGDLARAVEMGYESLRLATAARDTEEIIVASVNVASVLLQFDDAEGARRVLSPVLPLCERYRSVRTSRLRNGVHQSYGEASVNSGNDQEAMRSFTEVITAIEAHPYPEGMTTLALSYLGQSRALLRAKRFAEARERAVKGIGLNDSSPEPNLTTLATSRGILIQILEAMGDTNAIDSVRSALAAVSDERRLHLTSTGPTVDYWLARADRRLGRDSQAWNIAQEAERRNSELLLMNVRALPDSRALELARRKSHILDQVLDMAGPTQPARWEAAWDLLVRERGLVRAELARRRLPPELQAESTVVRAHATWVDAQSQLARWLVRGSAAPRDSARRAALDRLRAATENAEIAYLRELGEHRGDTTRIDIGLADVRGALRADQVLVATAEVQDYDRVSRMIAFVTRGGGWRIERIDLGASQDLSTAIGAWRERLATSPGAVAGKAGRVERDCRSYGERVRQLTWDRLVPVIGDAGEVVIVPDGPLSDVIWQALPVGKDGYLVETRPLIRLIEAERDLLSPEEEGDLDELLAFGDPDFSRTTEPGARGMYAVSYRSAADPCATGLPTHFPRLPGTGREVRAVADAWVTDLTRKATVLTGSLATEAAFRELAPGMSVIHVATHGVVLEDRCRGEGVGTRAVGGISPIEPAATDGKPRPSATKPHEPDGTKSGKGSSPWIGRRVWLALASAAHADSAGNDSNDGLLTAEEVVTLDLAGVDWVVLSACHSGLDESWAHEGAIGMRRAFSLAGARSVFTSHWAVEDVATADLMQALYTARATGASRAAEALARASQKILADRRRGDRSTHPFYWAAFTTTGE
jgi:tetratricopeptide (TPR) repeat protein